MKTSQLLVITFSLIAAFLPVRAADEEKPPAARLEKKSTTTGALRVDFEKATAAFHQALRTNDSEGLFAYVAGDVVMMPPNEAPIRGKPAMQTWYRTFLSAFRTTTLILTDQEVTVSDSWATELGQYEWGLQPTAGGDPVVDKGNYMQIWKRAPDGSWRFFREIWNSSIPSSLPANK
jgi:ketosteroid isomerase-like protein